MNETHEINKNIKCQKIGELVQTFESNCTSLRTLIQSILYSQNLTNQRVAQILMSGLSEDTLVKVCDSLINECFPQGENIQIRYEMYDNDTQKNVVVENTIVLSSEFYEAMGRCFKSFNNLKNFRNTIVHTDFFVDWGSPDSSDIDTELTGIKSSDRKTLKWKATSITFDEIDEKIMQGKELQVVISTIGICLPLSFDKIKNLKIDHVPEIK